MTNPVTISASIQALVDELIEFASDLEGGITARSNFAQIARKARSLTGSRILPDEDRKVLEQLGQGFGREYFDSETLELAYTCQDYETERDLNAAIPLIALVLDQLGVQPDLLPLPEGAEKCIFCPKPAVTADGQCLTCAGETFARESNANVEFYDRAGLGPLFPH